MENLQEKTFELLESSGLNWSVTKMPLFTANGTPTKSFGIFRNDHESPQWLGTVGERYEPFQNADLAETILTASESVNISINRGGLLNDGGKVYLQAQLPEEHIGKSNIRRWITALSSHDGSTSIGFGSSNTVVVCGNTFYRAFTEIAKFKHTLTAKNRIELAIHDLRAALGFDENLMRNFKLMADLPMKDEAIERVMRKIFDVSPDQQQSEISSRKKNQIQSFADSLSKETQLQGSTLWALFNSVTRYTNHISAPAKEEKKLDYLMDGGGYAINNRGYNEIMAWVEEHTAELFEV